MANNVKNISFSLSKVKSTDSSRVCKVGYIVGNLLIIEFFFKLRINKFVKLVKILDTKPNFGGD